MNHERAILRQRERRRFRVRKRLRGTADRPRLSISRSHRHIFAQLIDDAAGKTLVSAGSMTKNWSREFPTVETKMQLLR